MELNARSPCDCVDRPIRRLMRVRSAIHRGVGIWMSAFACRPLGCRRILDQSRNLDAADFGRCRNLARKQTPVFGAVLLLFPIFDVPLDFGKFESGAANC
jgi:hypothetical protein